MKASELRIGNLVDYEKTTHTITELHSDKVLHTWQGLDNYHSSYKRIEGIPITEEWLLKFGFKKEGSSLFVCFQIKISGGFMDLFDDGSFNLFREGDMDIFNSGMYIKYVHQLQNLFFVLTGKELHIIKSAESL